MRARASRAGENGDPSGESLRPLVATSHSTVTLFARLRGLSTSVPRAHGRVIREQLQRHDVQDRRQRAVVLGHADDVHAFARVDARVGVGEDEQLAAARAHLLQVALELFEQRVVGRDRDHRHLRGDERERAVLELAGRVGLGVDVADLLELQRAFERDRIVQAAAEEERVLLARELLAPGDDLRLEREHGLHRHRQVAQRLQVLGLVGVGRAGRAPAPAPASAGTGRRAGS